MDVPVSPHKVRNEAERMYLCRAKISHLPQHPFHGELHRANRHPPHPRLLRQDNESCSPSAQETDEMTVSQGLGGVAANAFDLQ